MLVSKEWAKANLREIIKMVNMLNKKENEIHGQ